jgi:hypothetical protein
MTKRQSRAVRAYRKRGKAAARRTMVAANRRAELASAPHLQERPDDVVLVEVDDDGTALVFGQAPPGSDLLPLTLMRKDDLDRLTAAVASSTAHLNLGAQLAASLGPASGLVRLAPATLQALRAGATPLVADGWNLGSLASAGKITTQVRWLPAASAGAASVLATLGPALALVAIQWQLGQISKMAAKNIALTNTVLKLVRTEQWAHVRGHHDAVVAELEIARSVGAVTDSIWQHIQSQATEAALRASLHLYLESVQSHRDDLRRLRSARERRDWIGDNGEAVLRDVDALAMAQRAWFAYQALRAGHLSLSASTDPEAAKEQAKVLSNAMAMNEQVDAVSTPVLLALYRQFRLMEECPGGAGLTVLGRRQAPKDVSAAARVLAEQVQSLSSARPQLRSPAEEGTGAKNDWSKGARVEPALSWSDYKMVTPVTAKLRWLLAPSEALVAVEWTEAEFLDWDTRMYVVFTDRRILICGESGFDKYGSVDGEIHLDSVDDILVSPKIRPADGNVDVVVVYGGKRLVMTMQSPTDYDRATLVVKWVRQLCHLDPSGPLALGA